MNDQIPPLMRPFAGLRAAPARAAEVAAPPYDVLTAEEARALAAGNRWSFVHVNRPEVDLPTGADPHGPEAHAKAAEIMARFRAEGVLVPDPAPRYYVYRLSVGGHVQTGIVGAASLPAYEANRIRRHEMTTPGKETDRVRHMEALGAQTGPVMMAHRPSPAVADVIARVTNAGPEITAAVAGVDHALWVVADDDAIHALDAAFAAMDAIYIADGHHRTAAAARVGAARRDANPGHRGDEAYNSFLAVSFPSDEVRILDYNRVVRDLAGLTPGQLLERAAEAFTVETDPGEPRPVARGQFGLYVDGRWHRLTVAAPPPADAPPLARLDIAILSERLLGPLLGIGDPRNDPRIDFVGGIRGLGELQRQVDSGAGAAAFALYPTAIGDMMAVADAGEVMPPKCTWFEPKLADGLVSHLLD